MVSLHAGVGRIRYDLKGVISAGGNPDIHNKMWKCPFSNTEQGPCERAATHDNMQAAIFGDALEYIRDFVK